MIYSVFILLMVAFALVYLWIGKKSLSSQETDKDYFLNSRSLKGWNLTLTLFASQLGAGALLGSAESGYKDGWMGLVYPLGIFFGLICLGGIFGPKLRKLQISTVAEIFELRYQSKTLRQLASYLSIFPLFFILIAQCVGARKFFLALGIESPYFFLIIGAIFLTYTVLGGLKAIVKADVIQVLFILFVFGIAFFLKWGKGSIPLSWVTTTPLSWTSGCFASLLITTLYMGFEQDMGQKCFAAKSPRTVTFAAIFAAFLVLFCSVLAVDFGISLKEKQIVLAPGQDPLITSIMMFTNPFLSSCIACAILMVILSTTDSLLCAISSNLLLDLPFWKNFSGQKKVVLSRIVTLGVGTLGILSSFFFQNILSLLLQSYEFSVCVLCPSIMMALFSKKISKKAAILSMILGALSFLFFPQNIGIVPKEFLCLALSFGAYLAGLALWKKETFSKSSQELT